MGILILDGQLYSIFFSVYLIEFIMIFYYANYEN